MLLIIIILILLSFSTGALNSIRRNLKNNAENVRAHSQDITELKATSEQILNRLDVMNKHLQVLVAQKCMDSESIDNYLPFPDNATIFRFLQKDDKFDERKFALEQILLTTIPSNKNQKHFADALCKALFTRSYIASHKWPIAT